MSEQPQVPEPFNERDKVIGSLQTSVESLEKSVESLRVSIESIQESVAMRQDQAHNRMIPTLLSCLAVIIAFGAIVNSGYRRDFDSVKADIKELESRTNSAMYQIGVIRAKGE